MRLIERTSTQPETRPGGGDPRSRDEANALGLVVVWARADVDLVGCFAALPRERPAILGRGEGDVDQDDGGAGDREARVNFMRQRPGRSEAAPALATPKVSRRQLVLTPIGAGRLRIDNVGLCSLVAEDGRPVDRVEVGPGDLVQLGAQVLFLVVERARWTPTPRAPVSTGFPFGRPDAHGLVGESPAAWRLREDIAFAAAHDAAVLITGPSGVGKELVARAVHAASARAGRPLIARNAATLPAGLIDAELFGNARNYPHAGLPERPGLVGEAEGGTLFLDEIAELPEAQQSHLLRLLDAGEYQRLGEAQTRRARLRFVAATNRGPHALKHDLAARFTMRIAVPGLDERREDIPLVAAELLRVRLARGDGGDEVPRAGPPPPALSVELVRLLMKQPYRTHVRELEALLWEALRAWAGAPQLAPPSAVAATVAATSRQAEPAARATAAALDPAAVQLCLDQHEGNIEASARALGLSSRHVLVRFIAKHHLRAGVRWHG